MTRITEMNWVTRMTGTTGIFDAQFNNVSPYSVNTPLVKKPEKSSG